MVDQLCPRRPHVPIAVFSDFQAKIDIVVSDLEPFLIEPSGLDENALSHGKTCGGHCGIGLQQVCPTEISGGLGRKPPMHVRRTTAHPHNHTTMLDGAVRVEQFSTHRSHLRHQGQRDHFR